jgi:hypothetical protein
MKWMGAYDLKPAIKRDYVSRNVYAPIAQFKKLINGSEPKSSNRLGTLSMSAIPNGSSNTLASPENKQLERYLHTVKLVRECTDKKYRPKKGIFVSRESKVKLNQE